MSHKRLLIVEPDRTLGSTYMAFFQNRGYEVQHALHAQDAIFAADSTRPDIVLLEMQLSGHNGVEFLHEFRSYQEWRQVPVIILSLVPARSLNLSKDVMRQLGITHTLYKPAISLRTLGRVVDSLSAEPAYA